MIQYLIGYFLTTFGFCYVVGHSKISLPFRELLARWAERPRLVNHLLLVPLSLIECPACLGWWVGLAAAWHNLVPFSLAQNPHINVVAWSFATCGAHYLLATWTGWITEEEA